MHRVRTILLLLLMAVAFGLVGRMLWAPVEEALASGFAAVPSLFSGVPVWVWWVAFGVAMKFACPMAMRRRACSRSC